MSTVRIDIDGRYPDMNKIINASRTHWSVAAKLKKDATKQIAAQLPNIILQTPIFIEYDFWIPKKCRLDPDNIFGGFQKAFLDALQEKGLIKNDSKKEIVGFTAYFHDSLNENYSTVIKIEECYEE